MSHRRAKQIRRALFPTREITLLAPGRVSRGHFLRATTKYQPDRFRFVLAPRSPREIYQHVKRRVIHGHAKPA